MYAIVNFNFDYNTTLLLLVSCLLILLINIYFIYSSVKITTLYHNELELEYLKKESALKLQNYYQMQQKYEQSNQIIHDIKKHIQIIAILLQQHNEPNGNEYISSIKKELNKLDQKFAANSQILDIIINEKAEECSKNDINLLTNFNNIDLSFIDDFDLVTIFSNLLDNAIEAVKLIKANKVITLKLTTINDNIIIKITNPCSNSLIYKNNRLISSKPNHYGLGIKNVKQSLSKYSGIFDIQIDNNYCTIFISIPINN